jgi:SnoaL-like domain
MGSSSLLPSPATAPRERRGYGQRMSPADLSMRYVATLNARDYDGFRRLLADPLEFHVLGGPMETSADEVVSLYRKAAEQSPASRIEIDHLLSDEEWVALEVGVVANATRTDTTPRFGVFHRWSNDKLVYYRVYVEPT